jgi:PAS domain S-box-containing protein
MQDKSSTESGAVRDGESSILEIRRILAQLEDAPVPGSEKSLFEQAYRHLDNLQNQFITHKTIEAEIPRPVDPNRVFQPESMLQAIFDHTPIGVAVVVGPDGIIKFANQAYIEIIPYPQTSPLGKSTAEVWPPEDGFQAVKWYQRVYTDGEIIHNDHVRRQYPDGSTHYFSLHVQPFCWGSEQGALIIGHDITQLIEAGQEAQESKRILDALMRYIPEGITIADAPDVRIRQVSRFGQQLTGRTPQEIEDITMEAHPEKWQIYYPDGSLVPADQLPLSRAVLTGEIVNNEELIQRRPDGEEIIILCNAGPIHDESGSITGGLIAWRDITERQHAEEQLRQREELLQKLIDNIPVIIVMYPPDIKGITVNKEFERVTGWTQAEVQSMNIMEVCYPDPVYRQKVADFMDRLYGWMDIEMTIKDGSRIETTWSNFRLKDDTNVGIGLDIRQRKQFEQALQESEMRFRSVLDHSIDAAYRRDLGLDKYDYMSPAIEHILGISAAEMTTMGIQEVLDRIHPDDRSKVEESMQQLTKTGKGKFEYRFKGKDGRYRWLADYSNIIYAENGTPRYRAGIVRDETERKQFEQALQESEMRFRALADNIAQLAWMTDPTGWIYWYNQRWFDYTGTTLEEMQGWDWQKVHHPDHVERVVEKFKHHLQIGQPWEDTFPIRAKDGQYRWFLSRALPIHDEQGQVLQWFGTNTDITEQLQIEAALRQSEERFRIALEGSPMVVFSMDRDLRYTWIYNPRDGFTIDHVIGKRDEDLIGSEEAAGLTAFKREVLLSDAVLRKEITYRVGQSELTYVITAEPLHDHQGQVIGLIGAAIDMTDIRRMEQEAFEQRTRIEVQRLLIGQREEERARIAREIHDGPVQAFSILLFGLEELNWIEELDQRKEKLVEIEDAVQKQIQDLRGLCNELRPSTLHFFGLEKAIRSHVETISERFPDVEFKLHLTPDGTSIPADVRLEMYRIFQEATNNCLKHASPSQVTVYLLKEDGIITLEIEDDGIGFQLNPQREMYAKQGSLGLIGMQERADIIGGNFRVSTRPGTGTRVTLQVPLPPSEE